VHNAARSECRDLENLTVRVISPSVTQQRLRNPYPHGRDRACGTQFKTFTVVAGDAIGGVAFDLGQRYAF